jgi:hypothetical protein
MRTVESGHVETDRFRVHIYLSFKVHQISVVRV